MDKSKQCICYKSHTTNPISCGCYCHDKPKLKRCPFCGNRVAPTSPITIYHPINECILSGKSFGTTAWNTRHQTQCTHDWEWSNNLGMYFCNECQDTSYLGKQVASSHGDAMNTRPTNPGRDV